MSKKSILEASQYVKQKAEEVLLLAELFSSLDGQDTLLTDSSYVEAPNNSSN